MWLASGSMLIVWWSLPVSGAEIAPLPSGSGCCTPASLPGCGGGGYGKGPLRSQLALLWYSLNPLFHEQARLCTRLEPFMGKFFFFLSLWQSHSLVYYLMLVPSDCPQGIQA